MLNVLFVFMFSPWHRGYNYCTSYSEYTESQSASFLGESSCVFLESRIVNMSSHSYHIGKASPQCGCRNGSSNY